MFNLVHFVLIPLSKRLMSSFINTLSLLHPFVSSEVILIFSDLSHSLLCFTLKEFLLLPRFT